MRYYLIGLALIYAVLTSAGLWTETLHVNWDRVSTIIRDQPFGFIWLTILIITHGLLYVPAVLMKKASAAVKWTFLAVWVAGTTIPPIVYIINQKAKYMEDDPHFFGWDFLLWEITVPFFVCGAQLVFSLIIVMIRRLIDDYEWRKIVRNGKKEEV